MNFLVRGQRDVVSLESPVHWPIEGVRQVRGASRRPGPTMEETLRSVMAVRPEVLRALRGCPTRARRCWPPSSPRACWWSPAVPAQTARARRCTRLLQLGVPPQLLARARLAAVTCQRLVRQICRICREPAEPPAPQTLAHHGDRPEEAADAEVLPGQGLPDLQQGGLPRPPRDLRGDERGRPRSAPPSLNELPAAEIEAVAVGTGMTTLRERCLELVREGVTTFDEFVRLRL